MATDLTPKETLQEKVITNVHSILYWLDKNDIFGAPPVNPASDPQFNHWEIPVQNWWAQNSGKYKATAWNEKPVALDDAHTDLLKPKILIIEPNNYATYLPNKKINLKISSLGPYPLLKLDVFVNDSYLGTSQPPFVFSFIPKELENLQTENELKIIARDNVYNSSETILIFKVQQ